MNKTQTYSIESIDYQQAICSGMIDDLLVDIVEKINKIKGLSTYKCCSGHIYENPFFQYMIIKSEDHGELKKIHSCVKKMWINDLNNVQKIESKKGLYVFSINDGCRLILTKKTLYVSRRATVKNPVIKLEMITEFINLLYKIFGTEKW